jgi:hypothetical protein
VEPAYKPLSNSHTTLGLTLLHDVTPDFPWKTECISYVCQDHKFHTYDRLMSVISQDIAQNVQKRFINFYYTHEGRHEGLYMNNDNYEDTTPSSSSTVL